MIDAKEKTSPDTHHELLQWQVSSSSSQTSSPVLPPLHPNNTNTPPPPSSDIVTGKDIINGNHHNQTRHSYNPSSNSYYSADAGKHGFLLCRTKSNGSNGSDSSDDNGSIVFKYMPGEETPPAEYALPASILQVYGEDRVVVDHVVLRREASEQSNCSSISFVGDDEDGKVTASTTDEAGNMKKDKTDSNGKRTQLPTLPLLAGGDNSPSSSPKIRILPYQERKRLNEGPDEDRTKKMQLQIQTQRQRKKKSSSKKEQKARGISVKADDKESSSLLPSHDTVDNNNNHNHYYGATSNQNGNNGNSLKNDHDGHQQRPKKTGWFGNLVTIVTGKDEQTPIEEESKSYRDQARAFLEKTEEERMKTKEMTKMEELNQLNIPSYRDRSFGHSRAKMSSLTHALDSIASCSDDEDDDTTDEESSSYEYDEDEESGTPIATNVRVWKYGDRTVTSSKARKISLRDERMERERLIEEEYEYRLRVLRHENERLAIRFRFFVLISVAVIFVGALAFAFVVCIRLLFG